jgi:WD40 repeat protein
MKLFDASKLKVDEESGLKGVLPRGSGNFLVAVGTKEGRVFIYRYSAGSANDTKLFWTKEGTVYGAITSLDISPRGDDVLAGSAKGEIHHWGLLDKINKYESGNI